MSAVRLREAHLNRGTIPRHRRRCYPLFESWNSVYNHQNLMESIMDWEDYSADQDASVKQAARLLQEVAAKGTEEEAKRAAELFCEEVLSYVKSPDRFSKHLLQLEGMDSIKPIVLDRIELLTECDRVKENYQLLSERFDLNRLFIDACNDWGMEEAMVRLCECVGSYSIPDFETRFCVTVEDALYGLSGLVQEHEIPVRSLVEGVIDYHLVNDGCNNPTAYIKAVREAIEASDFIPDVAEPYLGFLEAVHSGKMPYMEEAKAHYSNPALQAIAEYDEYLIMKKSIDRFYESKALDDAREWIAKIKLAPLRNVNMVKEAIRAVLVTRRLQDIQDGVHNALAIAFYAAVTVGFATIGTIPAILGLIASLLIHSEVNKQYLRNAIDEWKDHRYSVERKMRSTKDATQRRRLQAYLAEVEKNVDLLTAEYEKRRDRTAGELEGEGNHKGFLPGNDDGPAFRFGRSAEVDPMGQTTPASELSATNSLVNAADRRRG